MANHRRRTDREHYRPRGVEPLTVIATSERLAMLEATGAVGREITKDEGRVALAVCRLFTSQLVELETKVAELQEDLIHLRRIVG